MQKRWLFTGVFVLGLTMCLAFPPHAISWWSVPALAIFIYGLSQQAGKWRNFFYGYIFYIGASWAFIGQWFSYYFRLQIGCGYLLSYFLTFILCLYVSLYIGLICLVYNQIKTRWTSFNYLVLFPALWVLTELARDLLFPRSWYALGYTQVDNLLFRGYYALFGVYFVSWLLVTISGGIALCLTRATRRNLLITLLSLAGFALISLALAQIQYTVSYGKPIKVSLLQPSVFSSKNYTMDTLLSIEQISQQLVESSNAQLIVLPETVFGTGMNYLTTGYLDKLNQIVADKNAVLIFGTPIHGENGLEQTGSVISTDLTNPIYRKHHLVPFGEYNPLKDTFLAPLLGNTASMITEYSAGAIKQSPTLIYDQLFALDICYENTINDFVAENAAPATIMLNQSDLSWYGETNMKDAFFQFSQARALENQKYFLQDGNTGDTAIINQKGQVEVKIPAYVAGDATGMVQGYSGSTPFVKWGNLPLIILCGLSIGFALFRHKRE